MNELTSKSFSELVAHVLKFPLFIKHDGESNKQQNVVLEIHCYDPNKEKEERFRKAAFDALQEEELEKRVKLFEEVSQDMERSNYESYKVGEVTYNSKPEVSNIKVKSDFDGKSEEITISDDKWLEPLFVFLDELSEDHRKRLSK